MDNQLAQLLSPAHLTHDEYAPGLGQNFSYIPLFLHLPRDMSCRPADATWAPSCASVAPESLCQAASSAAPTTCSTLDGPTCSALMGVTSDGHAPCAWCGTAAPSSDFFQPNPSDVCLPQPHGWYDPQQCNRANVECGWVGTGTPPSTGLPLPVGPKACTQCLTHVGTTKQWDVNSQSCVVSGGSTTCPPRLNQVGDFTFQCRYGDTVVDYSQNAWEPSLKGRPRMLRQFNCTTKLLLGGNEGAKSPVSTECSEDGTPWTNTELLTAKFEACAGATTEEQCIDIGMLSAQDQTSGPCACLASFGRAPSPAPAETRVRPPPD